MQNEEQQQEKLKRLYKSTIPSVIYHFKSGGEAVFKNGRFVTDLDRHIEELDAEIGREGRGKSRHPIIYIDPLEKEASATEEGAMEKLRKEIYAKARADVMKELQITSNVTQPAPSVAATQVSPSDIFASADVNQDGKISVSERLAAAKARAESQE